jgi:hypothetical protein
MSTGAERRRSASARRVVVKIGTNVPLHDDGRIALGRMPGLCTATPRTHVLEPNPWLHVPPVRHGHASA